MISAEYVIGAHARDFLVNCELPLLILKTLEKYNAPSSLLKVLDVFNQCL
jgi:hypothetical protein